MKTAIRFLFAIGLFVLYPVSTYADGAASPQELGEKVKQAIVDKDSSSIEALYYWQGVSPEFDKLLKESITYMLDEPARKSEVRSLPDDFHRVQELGGEQYVQNLEPEGVVVLIYSLEDDSITASMVYGKTNGRYYFTAPVPK